MILMAPKEALWSEGLYGITCHFLTLYQNGTALDNTLLIRSLWQTNSQICLGDIELNYETYLWHTKEQASGWKTSLSRPVKKLMARLTSHVMTIEKVKCYWVFSKKILSIYIQLEEQLAQIYLCLIEEESLDQAIYEKLHANCVIRQNNLRQLQEKSLGDFSLPNLNLNDFIMRKPQWVSWKKLSIDYQEFPKKPDLLKDHLKSHHYTEVTWGVTAPWGPKFCVIPIQSREEITILGQVFSDVAHPLEFRIIFAEKELIPLFKKTLMNEWDLQLVTDKPEAILQFIQKQIHQLEMIGSLKHYALELRKNVFKKEIKNTVILLNRLKTFQDNPERNRILADYYRDRKSFYQEAFYLKKILTQDPTQLWAAKRLVGNFIHNSHFYHAWFFLTKLHQWNPLDLERKEILSI